MEDTGEHCPGHDTIHARVGFRLAIRRLRQMPSRSSVVRVTLTNHRRLTRELLMSGIRALIGQSKPPHRRCIIRRNARTRARHESQVDGWIRADPKTAEWHEDTARRAKETARNYSRLLHLFGHSDMLIRFENQVMELDVSLLWRRSKTCSEQLSCLRERRFHALMTNIFVDLTDRETA